jgi:DNA-binding IclR family transcriptional regulator
MVKPYLDELSFRFNKAVNLAVLDDTEALVSIRAFDPIAGHKIENCLDRPSMIPR